MQKNNDWSLPVSIAWICEPVHCYAGLGSMKGFPNTCV